VEHAVELQAGQAVVGRDAVLVLLREIEAEEDLAVAVVAQLAEDLADQAGALAPGEVLELAGAGERRVEEGLAVGLGLAPGGLAEVLDGEAAGDAGEEARQLRGLAQLTAPQLFEGEPEGVLEEVLGLGPAVRMAVQEDRDAAPVGSDQPLLGVPVPGLDPGDQRLRRLAVSWACRLPDQAASLG
jgi:hypothetical protein